MVNVSQYFPFARYARVIDREVTEVDLSDSRYLRTSAIPSDVKEETIERMWRQIGETRINLVRLMPNNVIFYNGVDEIERTVMNYDYGEPVKVRAIITNLAYDEVARNTEIADFGTTALYDKGNGNYIPQEIVTDQYLEDAMSGDVSDISKLVMEIPEMTIRIPSPEDLDLSEDIADFGSDLDDADKEGEAKLKEEHLQQILDDYFGYGNTYRRYAERIAAGDSVDNLQNPADFKDGKVPLLVGLSGVAKSAIVKDYAKKFNFRLIDFRASFMDRVDIDGLSSIIGKEVGTPKSMSAPMSNFLTCSDQFLLYARRAIIAAEKKMAAEQDAEKKATYQKVIDKYKDLARTPVLFLDEITRADKSVLNALTQILNARVFCGKYTLNECRIISATNAVVGFENDDLNDMFIGTDLHDVALVDRFIRLAVSKDDVYPLWIEWAEKNLHPLVVNYIKEDPNRSYNVEPIIRYMAKRDASTELDHAEEDPLKPPYPTFRAWENVSNYMKAVDKQDKAYNADVLRGFLGIDTSYGTDAEDFIDYIRENGYWEKYTETKPDENAAATAEGVTKGSLMKGFVTKFMTFTSYKNAEEMEKADPSKYKEFTDIVHEYVMAGNPINQGDKAFNKIKDKYGDIVTAAAVAHVVNSILEDPKEVEKYKNAPDKAEAAASTDSEKADQKDIDLLMKKKIIEGAVIRSITFRELKPNVSSADTFAEFQKTGHFDRLVKALMNFDFQDSDIVSYDDTVKAQDKFEGCAPKAAVASIFSKFAKTFDISSLPYNATSGGKTFNEIIVEDIIEILCTPLDASEGLPGQLQTLGYLPDTSDFPPEDKIRKYIRSDIEFFLKGDASVRQVFNVLYALYQKREKYKCPEDLDTPIAVSLILTQDIKKGTPASKIRAEVEKVLKTGKYDDLLFLVADKASVLDIAYEGYRLMEYGISADGSSVSVDGKVEEKPAVYHDKMKEFIADSLDSDLPCMMVGVSGFGKTTRVLDYCKERGYKCSIVNLGAMERFDMLGSPVTVTITDFALGEELKPFIKDTDLFDELNAISEEAGLNPSTTIYTQDANYDAELKRIKESGVPLVVFVDEFNRCTDKVLQSAIFEIISDNRIRGVQFEPGQLKVVLAGNLGETTENAADIDMALIARCSQFKKMKYEVEDAHVIFDYMKKSGYSQYLIDFFEQKGEEKDFYLNSLISSVDEAQLICNTSSTRSIQTLSNFLNRNQKNQSIHGTVICTDPMVLEQFNQFGESSYDVALSMMNEIKKNIGRWAARVPGAEYAGQGKDSLEKVIKIFEEKIVPAMQDPEMAKCFQDDGSNAQKAFGIAVKTMQNFLAIDNLVKQNRVRLFSDFVSKNLAEEFTEYYNTVSGMDDVVVTIDDLSDPSKIPAYVKNEYAIISATSPDEPKWHLRVIDIYKKYGLEAPFTADTYMEIMKEFIKRDISREMSQVEMKGVLAFEPLEEVILSWEGKMTEENNLPKYLDFIKSIGYSSSDYGKVIGTKGKKLPKSFI